MKALYMLNTKISASILAQYENTEDDLYSISDSGIIPVKAMIFTLFTMKAEDLLTTTKIPSPPAYNNRTIMLKYTHTFRL